MGGGAAAALGKGAHRRADGTPEGKAIHRVRRVRRLLRARHRAASVGRSAGVHPPRARGLVRGRVRGGGRARVRARVRGRARARVRARVWPGLGVGLGLAPQTAVAD